MILPVDGFGYEMPNEACSPNDVATVLVVDRPGSKKRSMGFLAMVKKPVAKKRKVKSARKK